MNDYRKYINALRKCAKEHENDRTFTGHIIVADLCRDTANLLEELEQEPKTGHWIEDAEQHHVEKTYHCSECGHGVWGEYEKTEYCGGCGAKMVEPQERNDKA